MREMIDFNGEKLRLLRPYYKQDRGWLIDNLLIAPKEQFKVKLTIKKVEKGKPKEV